MPCKLFHKFSLDEIVLFLWIVFTIGLDMVTTKIGLLVGGLETRPYLPFLFSLFGTDIGLIIGFITISIFIYTVLISIKNLKINTPLKQRIIL